MNARLFLRPETSHQVSTERKIYEWIHGHPTLCRDTNCQTIAKRMATTVATGMTTQNLGTKINRLVLQDRIVKIGAKRKATFRVNYLNPALPPDIRALAPASLQERVRNALANGGRVGTEGTIITPAKKDDEPKEELANLNSENRIETSLEPIIGPKPIDVPVQAKVNNDGKTLNLSITINLNI